MTESTEEGRCLCEDSLEVAPYLSFGFLCMCVAWFSLVRYRPVSSGRSGRIVRSLDRTVRSRLDRPVGVGLYKDEADIDVESG